MSELLNKAYRLIFNSVILVDEPTPDTKGRKLDVNLIVMSRDTFRELLRADAMGNLVRFSHVKDQPHRLGPARVAYDDTLGLGEMIVARSRHG